MLLENPAPKEVPITARIRQEVDWEKVTAFQLRTAKKAEINSGPNNQAAGRCRVWKNNAANREQISKRKTAIPHMLRSLYRHGFDLRCEHVQAWEKSPPWRNGALLD